MSQRPNRPRATKEKDKGSADLSGSLDSFCPAGAADHEREQIALAAALEALDRSNLEHVSAVLRFLFADDERAIDMVRALLHTSRPFG